MPLGDLDCEEEQLDEVRQVPQQRGRGPQDNMPVSPPPPPYPPQASPHHILPNEDYASAIVPPRIRAGNFQIINVMLTLLEQRSFLTGAPTQNAYKLLKGFMDTCRGRKQTNVFEDASRLRVFPFSLRGKSLDWIEHLLIHSINTWDELAAKFIAKFFSLRHMATLLDEI